MLTTAPPSKGAGKDKWESGFWKRKKSSIKHNSYKFQCWDVLKLPRKEREQSSLTYKKAIETWPRNWIRTLQSSDLSSTGCCHTPPLSGGLPGSLDPFSVLYFLSRHLTTGLLSLNIVGICPSITSTLSLLFTFWSNQEKSITTLFFVLIR